MSEEPAKYYAGPEPEPTGRVAIITESEVRANPGQRQLTLYSARLVPVKDIKDVIAKTILQKTAEFMYKPVPLGPQVMAEAILQAVLNMEPPAKKTLDK